MVKHKHRYEGLVLEIDNDSYRHKQGAKGAHLYLTM